MVQTETKYTMAQLRATKKSLFIRNEKEFLWKLSELGLELKPLGQPGSVAHLPHEALDNANVLRNYSKGNISISPDYEQEMFDLEGGERPTVKDTLLEEIKGEVLPSHQRNSIDAKEKMQGFIDRNERKRVSPQGQELGGNIEEFINPGNIRLADVTVDPHTGKVVEEPPVTLDAKNLKYTIERKVSN